MTLGGFFLKFPILSGISGLLGRTDVLLRVHALLILPWARSFSRCKLKWEGITEMGLGAMDPKPEWCYHRETLGRLS